MTRVQPSNGLRAMPVTRRTSLRSHQKHRPTHTKLIERTTEGSCTTVAVTTMSDSRSRPSEVIDVVVCVAAAAPAERHADRFGRMAVGESDALVEQLGEHGALIVGDDAVDAEQHAVAVSGRPWS